MTTDTKRKKFKSEIQRQDGVLPEGSECCLPAAITVQLDNGSVKTVPLSQIRGIEEGIQASAVLWVNDPTQGILANPISYNLGIGTYAAFIDTLQQAGIVFDTQQ